MDDQRGTRYPTFGFITGGTGAFNDGIPPQPYETFAYDSALLMARIENFNVIPYTSVLPPECRGNLVTITKEFADKYPAHQYRPDLPDQFKHGAVLEVIIAGNGANYNEHKAIATGIGIIWAKKDGKFIGGYAAEYVQYYDTHIDDDIAKAEATMWLHKSLKHELQIRGLEQDGEIDLYHNFLNIPADQPFGYCLTCIGFLNFGYAPLAK